MKVNTFARPIDNSSTKKQLKQWEIIEQHSRERIIKIGENFLKKQMESSDRSR